jgi:hypothetical protein
MNQQTEHLRKLNGMAYRAEWDGYDRLWHKQFAKNHSEFNAFRAGADKAKEEISKELNS